jgi:hypothetical protein
MTQNFSQLIKQLKHQRETYGGKLQMSAKQSEIERLSIAIRDKYNIDLAISYKSILSETNGFNENGVFLYGTKTSLIEGYSDRYLDGLLEANQGWHHDKDFSQYLFYADSDMYLFCQSLEIKTLQYSCRARDCFDEIIFETRDENRFFEKIFELALYGYIN